MLLHLLCRNLLTGGSPTVIEPITAGNGAVRCEVGVGYAGGSSGTNVQGNIDTLNGFVAYGQITNAGLVLQTDQLPVVNNFDGTVPIWPLGKQNDEIIIAFVLCLR